MLAQIKPLLHNIIDNSMNQKHMVPLLRKVCYENFKKSKGYTPDIRS